MQTGKQVYRHGRCCSLCGTHVRTKHHGGVHCTGGTHCHAYSGDEAIKFSSALTQWAIPAVAHGTFNANFALPSSAPSNGDATASQQKESGLWPSADGGVPHAWAPFNLAFATPLGYFSWLELPGNEARLKRFGHAMTGTRQWETKDGVLHGERSPHRLLLQMVK